MDTIIDLVNKLNSYKELSDDDKSEADEQISDIAEDFLGIKCFLSKEAERKAKNRARYKTKKYPIIKEFVDNQIKEWRDSYNDYLGELDLMRIMEESFGHD